MMGLVRTIHVSDYQAYLGGLGAEYVREGSGVYLFYLHEVGLWCTVKREGNTVFLDYYESESDCGC